MVKKCHNLDLHTSINKTIERKPDTEYLTV
jgi:hypothetical protein